MAAANARLSSALIDSEARRHEFEANLSHELMTPIAAIKGYSESLADGALKIPGRGLQFARIIGQHAERLTLVVEDILRLSSVESNGCARKSPRAIDLRAQMRSQIAGLRATAARRGISVNLAIPPRLRVRFRKRELSRILRHLLVNAIKYNRLNGRIDISSRRAGRRAIVIIRDSGIGVPIGDLPRIFDRFHRAQNARATMVRGSGLGLALVRSTLLAHGCRIWADSAEGKGTTMSFTLPLGRPFRRELDACEVRGAARDGVVRRRNSTSA